MVEKVQQRTHECQMAFPTPAPRMIYPIWLMLDHANIFLISFCPMAAKAPTTMLSVPSTINGNPIRAPLNTSLIMRRMIYTPPALVTMPAIITDTAGGAAVYAPGAPAMEWHNTGFDTESRHKQYQCGFYQKRPGRRLLDAKILCDGSKVQFAYRDIYQGNGREQHNRCNSGHHKIFECTFQTVRFPCVWQS